MTLPSSPAARLSVCLLALGSLGFFAACGGDEAAATEETSSVGGGGQAGTATGGTSGAGAKNQGGASGGGAAGRGGSVAGGASGGSAGGAGGQAQGGSNPSGGAGGVGGSDPGGNGGNGTAGADTGTGGTGFAGSGSGTAGSGTAGSGSGTAGTGSGTAGTGSGTAGTGSGAAGAPGLDETEVEMTFVTANVGRDYKTKPSAVAAFDKIADFMDKRKGPRFVGWQEIGEGDPCGACEWDALTDRLKASANWDNRRPAGKRPDGKMETVKVPVSTKEAEGQAPAVRAVYASAGWEGVSPTRFVTVVYYPERNLSFVNTHFIAKAWSCGSDVGKRKEYWQKAWGVLKSEVAEEHGKNRNVVVTGDLNRARASNNCNPDWNPASLHADARVVGGTGIDYVFAVPAKGNKFVEAADGVIDLTIDSHNAHWVSGKFVDK